MKICNIVFSKYYSEEHNAYMKFMIKQMSGIEILRVETTDDNEKMLVVYVDELTAEFLLHLDECDCLQVLQVQEAEF